MRTLILIAIATLAFQSRGQGRFGFNNFEYAFGPSPVTIGTPGVPDEGPIGAYLGSDYTASVYYLPGSGYTKPLFESSSPIAFPSADVHFFGVTGFPSGNFTAPRPGLFDGGAPTLPLTGTATIQIRVWYNVGASSYEDARNKGFNVGESNPLSLNLLQFPFLPQQLNDQGPGIIPFAVEPVPEPGIFGLCVMALVVTRRRRSLRLSQHTR
jgi:hypothetical protein